MSRAVVLPVIIVAAMLVAVAPSPARPLAILLGASAFPALAFGGQIKLDRNGQSVLGIAMLAIGLLVPRPLVADFYSPNHQVSAQAFPLASAALLLATSRLYIDRPFGGAPLTLASALIALAACGRADSGATYIIATTAFMIAAAWGLRRSDSGRAPLAALGRRHGIASAVGALVGAGVFLLAVQALPAAHRWAMGRIAQAARPETGFTDNLYLGSIDDMLQSDRIIMRVRGEPTDYLRGAVYTSYQARRWAMESSDYVREVATTREAPETADVVEVEFAVKPERYFAPLENIDVVVPSGTAVTDRLGVLRPTRHSKSKRIYFVPQDERFPPVADQDLSDRKVPTRLYDRLRRVALEWTAGATTVDEKLARIERRLLADYTYSLDFEHDSAREPIIDFLMHRKTGHCEYFASTMALLARTVGVPARVVGGYRVGEYNALGGYYIVRERHAHTWVEAWSPENGWQTWDPTPPDGSPVANAGETETFAAVVDLFSTAWEAFDDWLSERSEVELIVALLLLMLLLPVIRWWRSRRPKAGSSALGFGDALPMFEELARGLGKRGAPRAAWETLETWSARLDERDEGWAQDAAALLRRYAALRYGERGDAGKLADDIRRWVG